MADDNSLTMLNFLDCLSESLLIGVRLWLYVAAVLVSNLNYTYGLMCLSCMGVRNISQCHHTIHCGQSEICYTEVHGWESNAIFNTGCKPSSSCYGDASRNTEVVGRGVSDKSCHQCCAVDYCNSQLCSHAAEVVHTPGQCEDVPGYNCPLISSTFNVCGDQHHAKFVCRKFCGLCNTTDGGWSAWGDWSSCGKSCGDSQKVRVRQCNDPSPQYGGLDCLGDKIQYQNCSLAPCPGGWTFWSTWSVCSQTCDVGLQRRARTCSNPPPNYGGNHCFGDSVDHRVCYSRACNDGAWSDWSGWGTCSASCDHGIKSRHRSCDSPKPSLLGKNCLGNSEQYASCSTAPCPRPSSTKVYFSVHTPTGHLFSDSRPVFANVVINEGNDYDLSSGKFTVTVPGIYQFFVTFATVNSKTQCFIRKNRNVLVYALTTADSDWKSASASTYVHCNVDDVIDLSCGGWQYVDHNASSMFSGALVSAD